MSDVLRVRDHSQPCEHHPPPKGFEMKSPLVWVDDDIWRCEWCPGGREIVLLEGEPTELGDRVWVEVDDHE